MRRAGAAGSQGHARRFASRVVACAVALILLSLGPQPAAAQSDGALRLVVPETLPAPVSGQAPLRITITPASAIPRNAFVRIRGLPPMAALSEGHAIAPGAWAVSIAALPDLRVMIPANAQGRSTLTVTLVGVDGDVIAEAQTALMLASAPPPAAPSATAAPSTALAPEVKTPPALKPEDRERALRLFKRGQQFVEDSNVSQARLLLEKAADLGLADAALALGATYDESEITKAGLRGVPPDAKEARRWYERAAQLGAREAQQRLQRLGAK